MKVLITGGAGYLGRTIAYAFSDCGHQVVILDNGFVEDINIPNSYIYSADISDNNILTQILNEHSDIEIVIHCAERSTVSLSVSNPYEYYSLNVVKTMEMFKNLRRLGVKKIIMASSAAIYDNVPGYLVTERSPIKPRSPFGRTKYITEMILRDFCNAYDMKCIALRYFNPIGADPQSRCGVSSKNSANIISKLIRVMNGIDDTFTISGDDWETRDGTCIRDYIHVWDVAMANVKAAENFDDSFVKAGKEYTNYLALNVGSGVDVTVKEFIIAFENVTGEKIPTNIGPRRQGDISGSYAGIKLAKRTIDWAPTSRIEDAIFDILRWEDNNE